MDGKSNDEIASLLNLSVMTVKTQKKRAMHYIRERTGWDIFRDVSFSNVLIRIFFQKKSISCTSFGRLPCLKVIKRINMDDYKYKMIQLMHLYLSGAITDEEKQELQQWLDASLKKQGFV